MKSTAEWKRENETRVVRVKRIEGANRNQIFFPYQLQKHDKARSRVFFSRVRKYVGDEISLQE